MEAVYNKKTLACTSLLCLFLLVNYVVFTKVRPSDHMTSTSLVIEQPDFAEENMKQMYDLLARAQKMLKTETGNRGIKKTITIPGPDILNLMSRDALEELYYSYIENLQTKCFQQRHIGNEKDGGYHICEDIVDGTKPCLLYSFGIRKDFSFDDGVSKRYGCKVHSFDPFDGQNDHQHSKNVTFHKLGISGKDDTKRKLLTLDTIKNNLNDTGKTIDILKIDTEGAEWDSLTEMGTGTVLEKVRLLIVEFHVCVTNCKDGKHRLKQQYVQYLSLFKRIYDIGFRIYFFRMWPFCHFEENGITRTTCHEVHMMKI